MSMLTADGRSVWGQAHEFFEVDALFSRLSMAICAFPVSLLILLPLHHRLCSRAFGCL